MTSDTHNRPRGDHSPLAIDPKRYGPWGVIAGASEGTGAEFARYLAAAGINLVLAARRSEPLEALAAELRQGHAIEVKTALVDLATDGAAAQLAAAAEGVEVGIYVSNAGSEDGGSTFLDTPIETHLKLIEMNVRTVTQAVHHFGAPMRERGRGGIVLMSSGTALGGQARVAVYSGTKAFDLNLAESLWSELRPSGVDVIGCAAPPMATPMLLKTLARHNKTLEGIYEPADVVRTTLENLSLRPSVVFGFGEGLGDPDAIMEERRARVLLLESFFH